MFQGKPNEVEVVTRTIPVRPEFSAETIKELRKNIGATQATLANLVGVSTRTVEAWESNRSEPNRSAQKLLTLLMQDKSFVDKLQLI
ncbi:MULTISPECIES: helix-turn-helix domain-containing protein [Lactobacillus]|nr:helix-turn-helix domain-containing protein [Lactobacillus taiwanensis]